MDFQDSKDFRTFFSTRPSGFENNPNDILAGIGIGKLGYSVFDGLMLFEELGFGENLAASSTGEDIVTKGEELISLCRSDI
uniref:Uncharacterized protein n=1 Tax=Cucumis sativus TaxID=3659 RepID=A0A0A0KFB4_CUCSA